MCVVSLFVKGLGGGTLTCPFPDITTNKLEFVTEIADDAVKVSERPGLLRSAATTVTKNNDSAMNMYLASGQSYL